MRVDSHHDVRSCTKPPSGPRNTFGAIVAVREDAWVSEMWNARSVACGRTPIFVEQGAR